MTSRRKLTALCRILVPLIIVLAFHPVSSQAQATSNPPGQISYQGFLVDANGMPLATNAPQNYDVIIRIYNQPTGSTNSALWAELQTVTVDRGYFSVMLGQGSSVGQPFTNNLTSVFSGSDASDRYIGTTVRGLASGDAKWYFETSEGLADVKIYFTESEGLADKKIYYTKSEGLAKCDVDWKGYKKSNAGYLAHSVDALQFPTDALMRDLVLAQLN